MKTKYLFNLGQVVATPGALQIITEHQIDYVRLLARHVSGDWGVVSPDDKQANDNAAKFGLRIISAYPIDYTKPLKGHGDNCIWVLTEADRSATTILLPDEY